MGIPVEPVRVPKAALVDHYLVVRRAESAVRFDHVEDLGIRIGGPSHKRSGYKGIKGQKERICGRATPAGRGIQQRIRSGCASACLRRTGHYSWRHALRHGAHGSSLRCARSDLFVIVCPFFRRAVAYLGRLQSCRSNVHEPSRSKITLPCCQYSTTPFPSSTKTVIALSHT